MPGAADTVVGTAATGDTAATAGTLMPTHSLITAATHTLSGTMQVSPATISRRITPSRTITPVGVTDGAMAGVGGVDGDGVQAVVGGDEAGRDRVIGERAMRAAGGLDISPRASLTRPITAST
jgi:hypothetical protein